MEFKVGDTVKILDRVEDGDNYIPRYIDDMLKYAGTLTTITEITNRGSLMLDNNDYFWDTKAVKPVNEAKYLHPTELKEGDFIKIWNDVARFIYIFKKYENNSIHRYASFDLECNKANVDSDREWGAYNKSTKITYATEEEKNLLLETLAKEDYVWNYTTKQLQKVDTITPSNNIGIIDIPDQINSCFYNTIGGVAKIHTNVIYPAADITGLKEKSKEELNLFPTKKHYQLNFNY